MSGLSRTLQWVAAVVLSIETAPNVQAQTPSGPAVSTKSTVIPTLEIYSEFQRVDPFGNVVRLDKATRPREILSPAVPRNAHVSFHVAVTIPPGQNFFLFVVPNPLNACGVEMYREHFVRTEDVWIPDTLVELHRLPEFGLMPDPEQNIPGQNTRVYLLDLWIPPTAKPPGFRIEVQMKMGDWFIRPMEVRVIPVDVPNLPEIRPGSEHQMPELAASAEASAVGALNEYISGRVASRDEKPATVRGIIRRNAIQDMTLAGSLEDERTGPNAMRSFWKSIPAVPGAEWYLRIRDYIYHQAWPQ